jgi:hypothetical protein
MPSVSAYILFLKCHFIMHTYEQLGRDILADYLHLANYLTAHLMFIYRLSTPILG